MDFDIENAQLVRSPGCDPTAVSRDSREAAALLSALTYATPGPP
jgi:hypothetical protein